MLDLDPVHRADMSTICGCDYLREKDIADEDFFAEMHSRPIQMGADLVREKALKMSDIVPKRAPDLKVRRCYNVLLVVAV
jgi:hypothetical protein